VTAGPSIAEQLDRLSDAVALAHAEVSAGRFVELSDFSQRVQDVCAELESQPREQAQALAPKLRDLRNALDGLTDAFLELMNQADRPQRNQT